MTNLTGERVTLRPLREEDFPAMRAAHEAGIASIAKLDPAGALPPGVFEIGIELYDEADRGKGYGGEAVRLITHHLFADHEAERVQASTDVTNAAMRRALERAGYSEEGVMRWFRDGGNGSRDDYVLYAVTKPDWTRG